MKLKVREFKMNCFRPKFYGKEWKQKKNLFHSVYVRILLLPAGYIFGLWSYEVVKMTLAEVERSPRESVTSQHDKLGEKHISGLFHVLRYVKQL